MKNFYEHFSGTKFLLPISDVKSMDGWKNIDISENNEPLVALGAFSQFPEILTDSIYYGEASSSPYKIGELTGALITCFVRETLANMLTEASKLLPRGYAFIVWDGYRPLSVQNALHSDFVKQLMDVRGMSFDEANAFAPNYVSVASSDPKKPSPHFTGGSVDLGVIKYDDSVLDELEKCINDIQSNDWEVAYEAEMLRQKLKREHSIIVDVGAKFDEAKENAAVFYFERKIRAGEKLTDSDYIAAMNRRVFQNILRSVGFSSFEHEWWPLIMAINLMQSNLAKRPSTDLWN